MKFAIWLENRQTFDEFVKEVIEKLSIMGLPMNWMPPREDFHPFHAGGFSPEHTAKWFKKKVKDYERWIR